MDPKPCRSSWLDKMTGPDGAAQIASDIYGIVFEHAATGVAVIDAHGRIETFNSALCRICGYSGPELRNLPFLDLIHPDDRQTTETFWQRLFAGEIDHFEVDNRYLRKDGTAAWTKKYVSVLRKDGGDRRAVVLSDPSEHARAAIALRDSERRFRAQVNASSYVVYRMSPDWKEMRELDGRGFIADTVAPNTKWLDEYLDPADQPVILEAISKAIQSKSVFELEHRVKRPDGTFGWTLSRAVPLFDEQGEITEWFGAASDVTGRHLSEEKLRDSESKYRSVIDTATDAIIVIDDRGTIEIVNPATSKIFGYTAGELIGQNVTILMPAEAAAKHDECLADYLRTGAAKIIGIVREVEGRRKDGSIFPLDLAIGEWHDGKSRFTGIMRDISERKTTHQALADASRLEAVGQLAGGVAHDFNNLLAIIAGNLELAIPKISDEVARNLIQRAMNAAEIGASFNRRLLALAMKRKLLPRALLINERVINTAALLSRTLGENVEIVLNLAQDLWLTLADPGEVDSTLTNLAVNARDAMVSGGRLEISTRNIVIDALAARRHAVAPGEYVQLTVSDTGPGMAPEVLRRAPEPFFTTKDAGSGHGLGLSSVFSFAKQSLGFTTIISEVGKGTSVALHLPRYKGPAAGSGLDDQITMNGEGELVLVVEDDDEVREMTLKRLEALGYAVEEARNGPEALGKLNQSHPIGAVLSDVVMPGGMSGYDIGRWIAENRPNVKLVLCSGYNEGDRAADRPLEGVKILNKPYTRQQLAAALRNVLGSSSDA